MIVPYDTPDLRRSGQKLSDWSGVHSRPLIMKEPGRRFKCRPRLFRAVLSVISGQNYFQPETKNNVSIKARILHPQHRPLSGARSLRARRDYRGSGKKLYHWPLAMCSRSVSAQDLTSRIMMPLRLNPSPASTRTQKCLKLDVHAAKTLVLPWRFCRKALRICRWRAPVSTPLSSHIHFVQYPKSNAHSLR